jgi:hypothetical protein
MKHQSQAVVAMVVALCVLAVFVSPLVPTPLSNLRSHHGFAALAGIAPAGAVLSLSLAAGFFPLLERRQAWRPSGAELIDLTCVRLC